MARYIATFNANGTPDTSHRTLGTSSSGDFVVELDLSKVTTRAALRLMLQRVQEELLGYCTGP